MIIEESERPDGSRVATVQTQRGEEFLINLDAAVVAIAEMFSDLENEERFGWTVLREGYVDAINRLRRAAVVVTS